MKKQRTIENDRHPWAETRNRFPEDILLRGLNFTIHSRPRQGPAVWRKGSDLLTHREALAEVRAAMRRLEKAR